MAMPDQTAETATLSDRSSKLRKAGVAIACLIGATSFSLIALSLPFVLPALRKYCLPYVPATPIQIEKVLLHVKGRTGKVVDLGSGDGRVVSGVRSLRELKLIITEPYYDMYWFEVVHCREVSCDSNAHRSVASKQATFSFPLIKLCSLKLSTSIVNQM